jgi:hypothetical protein
LDYYSGVGSHEHGEEEAEVRLFKFSEKLATEFEKEKPTDGRFF